MDIESTNLDSDPVEVLVEAVEEEDEQLLRVLLLERGKIRLVLAQCVSKGCDSSRLWKVPPFQIHFFLIWTRYWVKESFSNCNQGRVIATQRAGCHIVQTDTVICREININEFEGTQITSI